MKSTAKRMLVAVLTWEARLILKKYKPKIVCVTGSVGKTSTKDALYTVLSQFFYVRKSQKSFNSETGIPLSILGVPNAWNNPIHWLQNVFVGFSFIVLPRSYPKWLILEVGADKPNDIKKVARWINPYAVVITRFPDMPVHIEFFKDKEQLIEEKSSLAYALTEKGLLLLNIDDEAVLALREKSRAPVVTYGFGEEANIRASNFKLAYAEKNTVLAGVSWTLTAGKKEYPVMMPHVIGYNHIYAVLPALALASHEGCDMEKAVRAAESYVPPQGRLFLIPGKNKTTLIDDTYNSSPAACEAALYTLQSLKSKSRKVAVLGDMLELGKHTVAAHKEIGKLAASACNLLITVGIRSKDIGEAAFTYGLPEDKIYHFTDTQSAGEFLEKEIAQNDIILLKGSQGVRLERAVKMLMANPEDAEKLLVRQEKEWLAKK